MVSTHVANVANALLRIHSRSHFSLALLQTVARHTKSPTIMDPQPTPCRAGGKSTRGAIAHARASASAGRRVATRSRAPARRDVALNHENAETAEGPPCRHNGRLAGEGAPRCNRG